jgi:hypothetical protein
MDIHIGGSNKHVLSVELAKNMIGCGNFNGNAVIGAYPGCPMEEVGHASFS